MRTKFPFVLQIDDENFNLIYKDPNKKQSDELLNDFKALKAEINLYNKLSSELELLNEKKELKKELVKELSSSEKMAMTDEIVALIDEIADKKAKLKELDDKSVDLEAVAMKRFELCVDGEDKDKLKEYVAREGISYHSLLQAIDRAVGVEREKK